MTEDRRPENSPKRKMSEMISDLAAPFITVGKTAEEKQNRLNAACGAWNMACGSPEVRRQQLDTAQAMIDRLLRQGTLDDGEELYLDALSDLVATYEDVNFPIAPASDADILRHLMEAKEVTQADLHRQTSIPKSTISEILAGKKLFSN